MVDLRGKKLYIPRMEYGGAMCLAAAFRSVGVEAELLPESDSKTLEMAGRYTSGDECLPVKIVLGDLLKVVLAPDFDPTRTVFFMTTTEGPCRFGQYLPYLRKILRDLGHRDVVFVSLTSENSYVGIGEAAKDLLRTTWQAVVASDILRKLLLKTRPFELHQGESERAYEASLRDVSSILERPDLHPRERFKALVEVLVHVRDRFRGIPRSDGNRLLIGAVGEIFCRLNDFSNDRLIRKVEAHGGQVWLSDVAEWIFYCHAWEEMMLSLHRRGLSLKMVGVKLKALTQRSDKKALLDPFREDFLGYEESEIWGILERALPYLPSWGAPGEMVLSVGKAVYLYEKGADGVIDISPFTCMNGIVSEAIYPRVGRDHDGIPIKNFYFDGTASDLDRDVGIFMELCRNFRQKMGRPL